MKKIILIGVLASVLAATLVARNTSREPAPSSGSLRAGPLDAPVASSSVAGIASVSIEAARAAAPSAAASEVEWKNRDAQELDEAIDASVKVSSAFVAKANAGTLTQSEATAFVTELRKQAVIARELTRLKLAKIEAKYQ